MKPNPVPVATMDAEGWTLSERADGFFEIQRYDDDPRARFATDAEALAFVRTKADQGSPMHAAALALDGAPCT